MRRSKVLATIIAIICVMSSSANAELAQSTSFTPHRWSKGLHLLAGTGISTGRYFSGNEDDDDDEAHIHLGINLTSTVGYYITEGFAFELNTNVNFNQNNAFLLWTSLFTVGFRHRLPWLSNDDIERYTPLFLEKHTPYWLSKIAPYWRLHAGWGSTVAYFRDSTPLKRDREGDRAHYNGPVTALGLGFFNQTSSGRVWFVEFFTSLHALVDLTMVNESGEIPTVVSRERLPENPFVVNVHLAVGVLAF